MYLPMRMNKKSLHTLDSPSTSLEHGNIILNKPFLKKIYLEWYRDLMTRLQPVKKSGRLLELGSGGGFLKSIYPEVITSDIMELPNVDMVCNAEMLPFDDCTVAGMMMVDVFHHIPRPFLFLKEAQRTLVPGGKIVMIEPANTLFGRFIYTHFHQEPFDVKGKMEIAPGNPLSNANAAFPYIYFKRELAFFKENYPALKINEIKYHTPFKYILSGGLSYKSLVPGWSYKFINGIEKTVSPLWRYIGLFCTVEIEKV
jgi:SAM-dependent methyltransferase